MCLHTNSYTNSETHPFSYKQSISKMSPCTVRGESTFATDNGCSSSQLAGCCCKEQSLDYSVAYGKHVCCSSVSDRSWKESGCELSFS